jgi:Tol biopolymer transport system component
VDYNSPMIRFAPDGKSILIAIALEGRGETSYIAPWPPGKSRPLFSSEKDFAYTPQLAPTPDDRYVIFAGSTTARGDRMYMLDTRHGSYWPILVQDRGGNEPSVSPDGSRLAYVSALSQADVIAVPLGEGPVRTLLGSFRTEQMADASQVLPQLVYVTDRRGKQEVWITSLDGSVDRPLFTPENFQVDGRPAQLFLTPVFSPDGKRVAVAAKGNAQIYVYTAFTSGSQPVRITSGATSLETSPTWSPDGQWIAFLHLTGDTLRLGKVHPGSGEAPVDIAAAGSEPLPVWSPTGDWIAAADPDFAIMLVSPDGKQQRKFPGGDGGPLAWSRDGKTLYHVRLDPPELRAIDIATGSERKLRDLPGMAPYSSMNPGLIASLTSDGQGIVYTVNRPRREIWILHGLQEPRPWYQRLLGR